MLLKKHSNRVRRSLKFPKSKGAQCVWTKTGTSEIDNLQEPSRLIEESEALSNTISKKIEPNKADNSE